VQFWGNNIIRTPKIMKRLFSESGAKSQKQGNQQTHRIDDKISRMPSDKHRLKRQRIHWQANQFNKGVGCARHKTQFIPVGISKSLLVVVFGIVFGRKFRDHHQPLSFHLRGRKGLVMAIHEHMIKKRID
jgi:hypothetical protein